MMRITIIGLILAGLLGLGAIAGFDWIPVGSASVGDEGCSWDPDGCPTWPGPTADEGCGSDPDGRCLPGS